MKIIGFLRISFWEILPTFFMTIPRDFPVSLKMHEVSGVMHAIFLRLRAEWRIILMMLQISGKCYDHAFIALFIYICRLLYATLGRKKILHVVSIYSLISDTREIKSDIVSLRNIGWDRRSWE